MTIRFQCPKCKIVRAANPRLLGREINCPECGHSVQLPTVAQFEAARNQRQRRREEELQQQLALNRILAQPAPAILVDEISEQEVEERMSEEERAIASATTSFTRPQPPQGEDMDMTPMVDVTFLLLIFFMITASFSVQKSIQRPAHKPDDASVQAVVLPNEDNPDTVTVQVDEFNAYNIITSDWDRAAGSKQDLIVALNDAHAGGASGVKPTKLIVQAHEDCIHASVVAALDAGREAQFESFEVNTVERFD